MSNANEIAIFAIRHGVPVAHAHVLPELFDRCSKATSMPVRQFIAIATYQNQSVADYVKEIAATVAAEVPAA